MLDLVICAIIKNEADYIFEWLSFHAWLGVRHFYLYDNNSTDNTRAVIESWPHQSRITVIDWPFVPGQNVAYQHMIYTHARSDSWCAFIDCDEFICPQGSTTLQDAFDWFEPRCNAFYMHWLMFGSSHQIEARDGLVTERFTRRSYNSFPPNGIGKTIVRLSHATRPMTAHIIQSRGRLINDNEEEIDQFGGGIHSSMTHKLLALNHYFTKSLNEWVKRRGSGRADMHPDSPEFKRNEEEFRRHDQNVVEDLTAFRMTQRMKPIYYPWRDEPEPDRALRSWRIQ